MEKQVSIFVCGVQKGGTTSLHAYFKKHPGLSAPRYKEIHFFDNEKRDWNEPDYAKLHKPFKKEDGDRLRFDITPIYGFWPPALGRIQAYNPSAKLIFLFRDPFDRAWSQYCMAFARRTEKLPFAQAIRDGRKRVNRSGPLARQRRIFTYVERGMYAEQVRRALQHFPRENILFLRSVDLLNDHRATLGVIASFLNIEPFPKIGKIREHKRPKVELPATPTDEDRAFFADLVKEDLQEFAALTGLDVSEWGMMRYAKAA